MKVKEFISHIQTYSDYTIQSDSGWECSETDINAAVINHTSKIIILLQHDIDEHNINGYKHYEGKFEKLYGEFYKVIR